MKNKANFIAQLEDELKEILSKAVQMTEEDKERVKFIRTEVTKFKSGSNKGTD